VEGEVETRQPLMDLLVVQVEEQGEVLEILVELLR